ncbi:MFS transporter [Propionibacterium freudenreichii]|nr:MFS transporter [Propionibacterium freudenreichii]
MPAPSGRGRTASRCRLIVAGAGLGYMFSAASTDMANRSIDSSFGEVSALTQTMKNLGGALSLAVLTSLVSSRLVTNLTGAFASFGGTSAQAHQVADALGNVTADRAAANWPACPTASRS